MLTQFQVQLATYAGYLLVAGIGAAALFLFGNIFLFFLRKAFALVIVIVLLAAFFSPATSGASTVTATSLVRGSR